MASKTTLLAKEKRSDNPSKTSRPYGTRVIRPSLLRLTVLSVAFWLRTAIAAIVSIAGYLVYVQFAWIWALAFPILAVSAIVLWVVVKRTVTITVALSKDEDTVTIERLFTSKVFSERKTYDLHQLVGGDGLSVDTTSSLDIWLSKFGPTRWLAVGSLTFDRKGTGGGIVVEGLADPAGIEKRLRDESKAIKKYEKAQEKRAANEAERENLVAALTEVAERYGIVPKLKEHQS